MPLGQLKTGLLSELFFNTENISNTMFSQYISKLCCAKCNPAYLWMCVLQGVCNVDMSSYSLSLYTDVSPLVHSWHKL